MPKQAITPPRSFLLSGGIFLSGAAWLVFELVWSRYLTLIFGASVFAVTSVLACWMLGMALGSWLLGRRVDVLENSSWLLVGLNLLIGAYGLLSPLIFMGAERLNVVIFSHLDTNLLVKNSLRLVFSFLVLVVPTFAMGGLLPLVMKLVTRRIESVGRDASYVYWLNTMGGALGAFVSGFVLVRLLGLSATISLASLVSFLAAGLLLFHLRTIHRERPLSGRSNQSTHQVRAQTQGRPLSSPEWMRTMILIVFAVSGFTSLAYEVFFTRVLVLFFRDSVYDFAIILTTFLAGLGLGSLICGRMLEKNPWPVAVLAGVEALIGFSAILSLGLIDRLPYVAGNLQSMPAFYGQYGAGYWTAVTVLKFSYAFGALLIPTCLLGMAFPLASKLWVNGIDRVGKDIGLLSGLNTLGSVLGALLAGFVFISLFGTRNSIILTALLNIGLGLLLIGTSDIARRYAIIAAVVVMAVVAVLLAPSWDRLRMSTLILDPNQPVEQNLVLLYYNEDAYGITSVAEVIPLETKFLTTNRLYSQNTSVMLGLEDHRRLGYIPLLLHPRPRKVLVIGLGAGITLRGVSEVPGLETIDCVEISEGVKNAARYFSDENRHVLDNPKIRFIIEDGRNFINTTRRSYDVIIADVFFPMSSGSSALFSREHFEASRAHLNPGGLMVQWLPAHQLSMDEIKIIARTFQSVFPHTSIWYGMIGNATPAIGLVGTEQELAIDLSVLEAAYQDPTFAANLRETNLDDPPIAISNFIMEGDSVKRFAQSQPVNSDDHPMIEFTNPLVYESFADRGVNNLLSLNAMTEDVLSYVRPGAKNSRDLDAMRARLEQIRFEIRDILLQSN